MSRSLRPGALLVAASLALSGCGSGVGSSTGRPRLNATAATTTTTTTLATSSSQKAGQDDYDGDGQLDPTCGTQDFGAGLVLRIPCQIVNPNDPDSGTTLVAGSLYRLPAHVTGLSLPELDNVSATTIFARDAGGARVVVFFINSDALFDVASSTLTDAAVTTLTGIVAAIKDHFPSATIQVRGHTDATGSSSSNQTLSEARANAAEDFLGAHGLDPGRITAVGLGSTEPLAEEHNADGSDNPEGRHTNRRVEIVVRVS